MRPELIQYLAGKPPPDPSWGGLGGVYRPPEPGDIPLQTLPNVALWMTAGASSGDLTQYLGQPYNQGSSPACGAAGTCSIQSLDESIANGRWPIYNWQTLYIENGGNGTDGVDPNRVMTDVIMNGIPLAGANVREKIIVSFAVAPRVPGQFRQALLAALQAGQPCGVALLLPTVFGWNSSTTETQGYHWMALAAGDLQNAVFFNTWGSGWPMDGAPKPGLCRLRWDYLEQNNMQGGFCYALAPLRGGVPVPPPVPVPPVPVPSPVGAVMATVNVQLDDGRRGARRLQLS